MTGLRPIAETTVRSAGIRLEPADVFCSRTAIAPVGLNPKALLLQLCARIGYTPHTSFQR